MRYPHTVCGNFGSLPLGGKKGKPHPGIKAKSASRMPRAGDDRIRYAVILEVYYDIFWRAWPPLQCAVGVAAEHTGAWVPRHITNPVLLLTPRSESEHMCVCVCVEIYITHSSWLEFHIWDAGAAYCMRAPHTGYGNIGKTAYRMREYRQKPHPGCGNVGPNRISDADSG